MADSLAEHLASLPDAALQRIARHVLGSAPSSRSLAERAIAQHLTDPAWLTRLVAKVGAGSKAALVAIARAGVPVARNDVVAVSATYRNDPIEPLELHGLVVAVKTGPGMPTHVALVPGLVDVVRALEEEAPGTSLDAGLRHASARRRFETAVLLGALAQARPRLTRDGRLHAVDLAALADRLEALVPARDLDRRVQRLLEIGAVGRVEQRIVVPESTFDAFDATWLTLALADLAEPSVPEGTLGVVSHLAEPGATLGLRRALEAVRVALLRERAAFDEEPRRGARRELAETLGTLVAQEGVLVLDAEGHAVGESGPRLLERVAGGEDLVLALDPALAAELRGEPPLEPSHARGHVQSSFDVVIEPGCEPGAVARIGAWCRLARADVAAVFHIERRSVVVAAESGRDIEAFRAALEAVGSGPVPANVWHNVVGWAAGHRGEPPDVVRATPRTIEALRDEVLAGIRSAPPVV